MVEVPRIDRQNVGYLLAKASQRWNERLGAGFREAGYPEVRPSYGSVLVPLLEEDGLRMGELARRSRLSKQTMTTIVRLCERDGLVYRERDPADGRAFRVMLTGRGRSARPVFAEIVSELDRELEGVLSEAGLMELRRLLREVIEL